MEGRKQFAEIRCTFKNIWNKIMKNTWESTSLSRCLLEKLAVAVIQGALCLNLHYPFFSDNHQLNQQKEWTVLHLATQLLMKGVLH